MELYSSSKAGNTILLPKDILNKQTDRQEIRKVVDVIWEALPNYINTDTNHVVQFYVPTDFNMICTYIKSTEDFYMVDHVLFLQHFHRRRYQPELMFYKKEFTEYFKQSSSEESIELGVAELITHLRSSQGTYIEILNRRIASIINHLVTEKKCITRHTAIKILMVIKNQDILWMLEE